MVVIFTGTPHTSTLISLKKAICVPHRKPTTENDLKLYEALEYHYGNRQLTYFKP